MEYLKEKINLKNNDVKYLRDLPDDSSPALVGGVMTKSVNDNEILATIVDLIRRKVLTLETSDKKNHNNFNRKYRAIVCSGKNYNRYLYK